MKQRWVGIFVLAVAWAAVASVSVAHAQRIGLEPEASFVEEFGPMRPGFGQAVALSADGTRALVGIPGFAGVASPSDRLWSGPGMAIVFLRTADTWTEEARLEVEEGELGAAFGRAVALSAAGDVALIGAPSDAGGTAQVFVREGASWMAAATLSPAAGQLDDGFGAAVALSADGLHALVGAPGADTASGIDAGRVHAFAAASDVWSEQAVLEAELAHAGEDFGRAVALSADGAIALIGSPETATQLGEGFGSAHVFERDGAAWTETARLFAHDAEAREHFGFAVALAADGATALIGAPDDGDDDPNTTTSGSARVFVRDDEAWSEEATLGGGAEHFGWLGVSVALSSDGQRAIAGAQYSNLPIAAIGDAHVFERGGGAWSEHHRMRIEDGEGNDRVGAAVAISADGAYGLIGAPGDDVDGVIDQGTVRVVADLATTPAWRAVLAAAPDWDERGFGLTVAITPDGTRAVVAAPETRSAGAEVGMVRVLARDGQAWHIEARLQAGDGEDGDRFGHAIAIADDGATIVVGAPFDDSASGVDSGSVRVFSRTGTAWSESVLGYGPQRGFGYGYAVAISGDGQRVLVGAPSPESDIAQRGRVFGFVRGGGSFVPESGPSLPVQEQVLMIGTSLAIDRLGERAVVNMYDVAEQRLKPRAFVRIGSAWFKEATLDAITAPFVSVVPLFMSAAGDRILADDVAYARESNVWTSQPLGAPALALAPDGDYAIVSVGHRVGEVRSAGACVFAAERWMCRPIGSIATIESAALAEGATRGVFGGTPYMWRQGYVGITRLMITPDEVCEGACDDGGVDASVPDAGEGDSGMMMNDAGPLTDAGESGAGGGGAGGASGEGGAGGGGAGGASGEGGQPEPTAGSGTDPVLDAGCEIIVNETATCSCRIEASRASGQRPLWLAITLVALLALRRRRRYSNAPSTRHTWRSVE